MVEVPAAVDASGLICPRPPERLEAGGWMPDHRHIANPMSIWVCASRAARC